jgi:hypothetical protein
MTSLRMAGRGRNMQEEHRQMSTDYILFIVQFAGS